MKENLHENAYIKSWVEDGIMFGVFKPTEALELAAAIECVKMRLNVANGISYPVLIDIKEVKFVPKATRDYLASPEACQYVKATALLINSSIGRIMSNFFLFFSKPLVRVEVFTDKQKAIQWLQKYVNKEQEEKLLQTNCCRQDT